MKDSGGVRIVFDAAIDSGAWPGTRGPATVGELWVGPQGLLSRLETELGLGGTWLSPPERACDLAAKIAGTDGWWRGSFEADPLGTAERLLRDRDLLVEWGWRGQSIGARLDALWAVTTGAHPGLADRLLAVLGELERRSIDVADVRMTTPLSSMSPSWQSIFSALAARGVVVHEDLATPTTSTCRLSLLRPHGALAAAEEVAASLAAMPSLEGVLVVGGDHVLDAALARHGLPRLGASRPGPASAAAARLVLEAAFEPMNPGDLHSLLCLNPGPVPRGIAWRLVGALNRFPGRRSPEWREALAAGLAGLDEDRRSRVAARLGALLDPTTSRTGMLPVTELLSRLDVLATWARGRIQDSPSVGVLIGLVAIARNLVALRGVAALTHTDVRRLCDDLNVAIATPGDAGLSGVAQPGAVLDRAETIVWWGFTRASAPRVPRLRLSRAERAALEAVGARAPDLGGMMEGEASRWRRPLVWAVDTLVLASPQTDETGEPSFPHPLWDELVGAASDPRALLAFECQKLAHPAVALRKQATLRMPPTRSETVQVPAGIPMRDRESPSSLERLLGCSLSWALSYPGAVRAGLSDGPADPSPLLYGNLAHRLLASVFGDCALGPADARARAEEIVNRDLAGLCENLALPRYQVELTAVRSAIIETAAAVGELLAKTGASVRGAELELDGVLAGIPTKGHADLVLDGPSVVLDFKWGRTTNRERLGNGAAFQLAAYAELLAVGASRPAVAYLILTRQELFGEPGSMIPNATAPGKSTAAEMWAAAVPVLKARVAELARGLLVAPGANGAKVEQSLLGAAGLVMAPNCTYCEHGGLCGRDFAR